MFIDNESNMVKVSQGFFKSGPGLNFAYFADDVCFESFFLNLSKSFWILFHYLVFFKL